ncbi:NifB/NifX family molybdenum-iron cluster-binding protein [Planctomycetota bacterium]
MKVAVTTQGQEMSSPLDPRFGRAQWIMVVDTDSGDFKVHDNTVNLNIAQGAGIQTAKRVIDLEAVAIVTGNVGPKAFTTLNAANVEIFLARDTTVADAIEALKSGELESVSQANVEGHWG